MSLLVDKDDLASLDDLQLSNFLLVLVVESSDLLGVQILDPSDLIRVVLSSLLICHKLSFLAFRK